MISVAGKDFVVDIDVDDRYKMDGAMKNDDTMEGTDMISSSGANNRMVQSGFVIDTMHAVCTYSSSLVNSIMWERYLSTLLIT